MKDDEYTCKVCGLVVLVPKFGLPKTGYFLTDMSEKSPNRQHYFCSLKCLGTLNAKK